MTAGRCLIRMAAFQRVAALPSGTPCRGGGIGRRASFRYLWAKARGGSSPLLGTKLKKKAPSWSLFFVSAELPSLFFGSLFPHCHRTTHHQRAPQTRGGPWGTRRRGDSGQIRGEAVADSGRGLRVRGYPAIPANGDKRSLSRQARRESRRGTAADRLRFGPGRAEERLASPVVQPKAA